MPIMKAAIFVALVSLASAQVLVPQAASNDFPACALSCTTLLSAQSACVPPAAPVTDQAIYVSCFCQSALLTTLHSSPDGTCDQWCTVESDRQELMAWYNNFCASGGASSPATTAPAAPVASTSTVSGPQTTVVYVTSTAAPTITATPTDSASSGSSSGGQSSWINTHWQWIVMVAVLLVGLGGLAWLAVCLKRRHKRKVEERRAQMSGFPVDREKGASSRASTANLESLFGPAQHMAATRGWEYPDESNGSAAAAIAGEKRRSRRTSRRHSSRRSKGEDASDPIQELSTDRSESVRRRDHEREKQRNKDIERGLRGAKGKDIEKS